MWTLRATALEFGIFHSWRGLGTGARDRRTRTRMELAQRIVVVGGSLAGLRSIEALRVEGYEGELVAVCAEAHMPYDRPPLSKQFLKGAFDEERLSLRSRGFEDLAVDWRLGCRAMKLDPDRRVILLSDGEHLEYGGLLIASGAAPRSLPGAEDLAGVHLLRSLDDSRALRADLLEHSKLVVIGAGFIGMEVAASARELGLDVSVVETLPTPLLRGLGTELGAVISNRFHDHGVALHCGVGFEGFVGEGRVEGVALSDGRRLEADLVLVGIGAAPACDWLEDSGLDLSDGVLCDAMGFTGLPDVVAAGDVSRWHDPRRSAAIRFEHWTSAVEQSSVAARRLLRGPEACEPLAPIPYVWSDLFELRLAMLGEPAAADTMEVRHGELSEERFLALMGRAGKFVGAVGLKRPRQLNACRVLLEQDASFEHAVAELG